MSEQTGWCSLIHKNRQQSYCKTEKLQTNTIAKVMFNNNVKGLYIYTATVLDVDELVEIFKVICG